MRNYKILFPVLALLALVYSCNTKPSLPAPTETEAKGELAFLLKYDGQMPGDVGLLRNQVVQRRLANMLKDSFRVFMSKTIYDRPIEVSKQEQLVVAQFFSDSDRSMPSADLMIDVEQDAMWVEYLCGDTIIEFTDHPSLSKPGLTPD
jgi:hypothetical protein